MKITAPKMDRKLIAWDQPHEVKYIRYIFRDKKGKQIPRWRLQILASALSKDGMTLNRSRPEVYKLIRAAGYKLIPIKK